MKSVILSLSTLKAIALASSIEETRYYLNSVCIEVTENAVTYCATDGAVLAARQIAIEPSDLGGLTGTFIIPAHVIKGLKVARKAPDAIALSTEDGKHFVLCGAYFEMVYGTFPDLRLVIPREPMARTTEHKGQHFDYPSSRREVFDKIAAYLDAGKASVIPNADAPALVHFERGQDLIGVIMPEKRSAPPSTILPSWFRAGFDPSVSRAA
jgi:hypothetical protein